MITAAEARKKYEESTHYVLIVLEGLSKRIEEAASSGTSLEIGPPGYNGYGFHKDLETMPNIVEYHKMNPAQRQILDKLKDAGFKLQSIRAEVKVGGGLGNLDPDAETPRTEYITKLKISW